MPRDWLKGGQYRISPSGQIQLLPPVVWLLLNGQISKTADWLPLLVGRAGEVEEAAAGDAEKV